MVLASLPSPSQGVWHLGPIPIPAYALCIIGGILVAIWLTQRRLEARGGNLDDVIDIAVWAVPFGIVGGRIYHVLTDPGRYADDRPLSPHSFTNSVRDIAVAVLLVWVDRR